MNHGRIELLGESLAVIHPGPLDSDDGPDLIRFCTTHEWASLPTLSRAAPSACPQCLLDTELAGRARYRALQQRLVAQFLTERTIKL